jgi:hypothetical protein
VADSPHLAKRRLTTQIEAEAVESSRMAASAELAESYRKTLKLYFGLLLLFTPIIFLVAFGMFKLFGTFLPGFILAGIWSFAWIASGIWVVVVRLRIRRSN